jgi:hypothetical protein
MTRFKEPYLSYGASQPQGQSYKTISIYFRGNLLRLSYPSVAGLRGRGFAPAS